ncbi:MAG: glycosyltransferase family 39 protein [Bryobacterales bacterium]|nr:glycosyltransferase family 39 protein [Bryobacterales bacterium]
MDVRAYQRQPTDVSRSPTIFARLSMLITRRGTSRAAESATERGRRLAAFAVLLLALLPAALFAWNMRRFDHLGYFHDDGMYWVSAKALATGQGYRILSLPGAPFQTKYPPLLPLLLAGVWKLFPAFPRNMPWVMALLALMLPPFLYILLRLLQSWRCPPNIALAACAWTALNPYIVFSSVNIMPDLLVSLLLGACILAAQRSFLRQSPANALLAGALGGAAYLTKSSVLPLLAAGPVWYAFQRKFRLLACFLTPLFVAAATWNIWSIRHQVPSADPVAIYYTSYLSDFLHDMRGMEWLTFCKRNFPTLLGSIGNLLVPDIVEIPLLGANFARLVGIFAIAGIVRYVRKYGMGLYQWFAAGYSAQLLIWQYPPNERFLIPIVPVIVLGAVTELRHLLGMLQSVWRSTDRGQRTAAAMIASLLALAILWAGAMAAVGHLALLPSIASRSHEQSGDSERAFQWMRRNLPPGARVLTYYDVPVFLHTGLQAMRPRNFPKEFYRQDRDAVVRAFDDLPAFARLHGIRYALLTRSDFDSDSFVKGIVDWNKLASSSPYRLLFRAPLAAVYEIEAQP